MFSKKISFSIILILLMSIFFIECSDNPVDVEDKEEEEEREDIVKQININWPSLGDTPWPMYHHDPQSTGRSEYAGPQNGIISIKSLDNFSTMSGISIGYNKTVLIPGGDHSGKFYAVDYNGNSLWESIVSTTSTSLISADSIIFLPTVINKILAYNHKGDTLWTKPQEYSVAVGVNIDKEGNIYFVNYDQTLVVLNKNGELNWKLRDDRFLQTTDAAPSFSPDGNTLYMQGINLSILAIDIKSRSVKWTFGDKRQISSPVIDNSGNIYIIPGDISFPDLRTLYSLNPEGGINWEFNFNSQIIMDNTEPTIDYDGNIYFGGDTLFSVTNSGKLRWKRYLNGNTILAPLVCDVNNDVYIGTFGSGFEQVFAFSGDGELKWKIDNLEFRTLGGCPAIAENETMFFPSWRNSKIAFSIIQ